MGLFSDRGTHGPVIVLGRWLLCRVCRRIPVDHILKKKLTTVQEFRKECKESQSRDQSGRCLLSKMTWLRDVLRFWSPPPSMSKGFQKRRTSDRHSSIRWFSWIHSKFKREYNVSGPFLFLFCVECLPKGSLGPRLQVNQKRLTDANNKISSTKFGNSSSIPHIIREDTRILCDLGLPIPETYKLLMQASGSPKDTGQYCRCPWSWHVCVEYIRGWRGRVTRDSTWSGRPLQVPLYRVVSFCESWEKLSVFEVLVTCAASGHYLRSWEPGIFLRSPLRRITPWFVNLCVGRFAVFVQNSLLLTVSSFVQNSLLLTVSSCFFLT